MGYQIHTLNPQLGYRTTHTTSKQPFKNLSLRPTFEAPKTTLFFSYNNLNNQDLGTIKQTRNQISDDVCNVKFKTLGACKLGISRYPDFEYNAEGGAGSGKATKETDSNGEVYVDFDVNKLYIPPLSTATTKFLGLPLPPFLTIDIVPEAFQGIIDQESGKVELKFRARFWFSIGTIYKAHPLLVDTVLTSEESQGEMRGGRGERMDKEGKCKLVGVAKVEPINDIFMDTFLGLPTECLASLNAIISFS